MKQEQNKEQKQDNEIKKNLNRNEEDVHRWVFEQLYPKDQPNNITTITKDNSNLKYVTIEYFNAKLYLLMEEISFISKEILDIKSYYKNISNHLDLTINNIIQKIFTYANEHNINTSNINPDEKNNIDQNNVNPDVNFDKKDINICEQSSNLHKKIKKNKKNKKKKHNSNEFLDDNFENFDKIQKKINDSNNINEEFPDIDLNSINFDIEDFKNDSAEKIDLDENSNSQDSVASKNYKTLQNDSFNKLLPNQSLKQKKIYFFTTKNKNKIYEVYDNMKVTGLLADYKGLENKENDGNITYYIFINFIKKKRIGVKDIEDLVYINVNFTYVKNIDDFLASYGRIIFDPIKNKK
jgi:hypothetical protein